jgi:hypothetical protein
MYISTSISHRSFVSRSSSPSSSAVTFPLINITSLHEHYQESESPNSALKVIAIMFTYREGIATVQVVFYVLALAGGLLLCLRHGFAKSSGWVLLITFSLLRLIGAIFEIVAIDHPTKQVITGAIVCISIGLSPLALMSLGLMRRVYVFRFCV